MKKVYRLLVCLININIFHITTHLTSLNNITCQNKECIYLSKHLLCPPSKIDLLIKNKKIRELITVSLGIIFTKILLHLFDNKKKEEEETTNCLSTITRKISELTNIKQIIYTYIMNSVIQNTILIVFFSLLSKIILKNFLNKKINFYSYSYLKFIEHWPFHRPFIEQVEIKEYFDEIYSLFHHLGKDNLKIKETAAEEIIQLIATAIYTSHTNV